MSESVYWELRHISRKNVEVAPTKECGGTGTFGWAGGNVYQG